MKSHHIVAIGTWGGDKQQLIEYNSCIAVGIDCPRAKLRVSILLDTIQEYQVRYISSDEEISEAVNKAGLIIGARGMAHEGILQRKPVLEAWLLRIHCTNNAVIILKAKSMG